MPRDIAAFLQADFDFFRPGTATLDVGCRDGRFISSVASPAFNYSGFDVAKPSIIRAMKCFNHLPNFVFKHADILNPTYNPLGKIEPDCAVFPFDGPFDFVLASSLFTHLGPIDSADRYIQEIQRVLRPGGLLYITFFRSPPNKLSDKHSRTVYAEADIINLLGMFTIIHSEGGLTDDYNDQWKLVVRW